MLASGVTSMEGLGRNPHRIGLDTVTDLWRIGELLQTRGYTAPQIEAILGGNFLRKLNAVLPNR
ncbi:MAG UNVERIFIED_CONTAM: dipeptidase [Anaerolineae bacterium]|jgi:microsomal dipeptidase-like Zn-dependent dipeptidase